MSANECTIADNMKKLLGVSRNSELARILGVDRSTVSTWYARGNVPIEHLLKCSKRVGCSVDDILSGEIPTKTVKKQTIADLIIDRVCEMSELEQADLYRQIILAASGVEKQ